MQAQAIKLDNGWFIKELPGFENITSDVIDLNIELPASQSRDLNYSEIRGIAIMERYYEKRERETQGSTNITDLQLKFRQKFSIASGSFHELLEDL